MRQMSPRMAQAREKIVSKAVEARLEGTGRPFLIGHLITNRCMCKCASCLWRHNDWEDVPTEELKRFYREAREEGFLGAAVTGGEPFLRADLGELVRFINQEAEMAILVFTTGWFLEERASEVLPDIAMLMMSLDASRPEEHDRIRGVPGLWNRLMKGVELVKRHYPELSAQFNCCVQKGVEEDIDNLIALTKETGMQISFDVITDYRHGRDGSHFSETNKGLPLLELRGICEYLLERKKEGAPILNSELYFRYFMEGKPGYKCHLPKLCMFLDGRGMVEDCLNLDRPIANIRETPLREILALPRFKALRADAEGCCTCNSPTMVDLSYVWENPGILFEKGGIQLG